MSSPIQAAIDLGTNTALMVIGRRRGNRLEILADLHAVVRLGQGVDAHGLLASEAMDRASLQIRTYAQKARELGAQRVCAWGTSALRDAANRELLIERVARESQIELRPLSGEDEAVLTFLGAGGSLAQPIPYGVIDIGGGSTEVALGTPEHMQFSQSYDVGSVRLSERYFNSLPPNKGAVEQANHHAAEAFKNLPVISPQMPLLGVAGTAMVLAALDAKKNRFDDPDLDGYYLSADRIEGLCQDVLDQDYAELCTQPAIGTARANIIGAGALILRACVRQTGCPGISVSLRGLRYGLLEQMFS